MVNSFNFIANQVPIAVSSQIKILYVSCHASADNPSYIFCTRGSTCGTHTPSYKPVPGNKNPWTDSCSVRNKNACTYTLASVLLSHPISLSTDLSTYLCHIVFTLTLYLHIIFVCTFYLYLLNTTLDGRHLVFAQRYTIVTLKGKVRFCMCLSASNLMGLDNADVAP